MSKNDYIANATQHIKVELLKHIKSIEERDAYGIILSMKASIDRRGQNFTQPLTDSYSDANITELKRCHFCYEAAKVKNDALEAAFYVVKILEILFHLYLVEDKLGQVAIDQFKSTPGEAFIEKNWLHLRSAQKMLVENPQSQTPIWIKQLLYKHFLRDSQSESIQKAIGFYDFQIFTFLNELRNRYSHGPNHKINYDRIKRYDMDSEKMTVDKATVNRYKKLLKQAQEGKPSLLYYQMDQVVNCYRNMLCEHVARLR